MTGIMQSFVGGSYNNAPSPPVAIGAAYGGGYFAGQINDAGVYYNLVVAPKSTGEASGKTWGTFNTSTGFTSVIEGATNSAGEAALGSSYQAATFCEGLTIGGYTDWYLPAKNELEVLYYFLKPNTINNDTSCGSNANAVSPEPISTNYTSGSPAQTAAGIGFRIGETNAFAAEYYWSSSEYSSISSWAQSFYNANQTYDYGKNEPQYVRAIRKIPA